MSANVDELFERDDKLRESPGEFKKYACTIVSLLPFDLLEEKPHMLPSAYKIPGMKGDKFGIFHVEEGIHYIANPLIDEGKPGSSIKQVTLADEMARSIVDDYASAQVCLGENATPGIFWVPGRLTAKQIIDNYPKLLRKYTEFQLNWFRNLCALADADWEKNHNRLAVSDLQRNAARAIGVRKEWVDFQTEETDTCRFCSVPVPKAAVKCPNCKEVLDVKRYEAMLKGEEKK
jgi:hypothetical protein